MFDWNEFLALAQSLATNSDDASIRSAISRAYYSAYNQARIRLPADVAPIMRDDSSHKQIWDIYGRCSAKAARAVNSKSRKLKGLRVSADYREGEHLGKEEAELAIALCQQILSDLQKLKDSDFRFSR